jgi:hypothetical protein
VETPGSFRKTALRGKGRLTAGVVRNNETKWLRLPFHGFLLCSGFDRGMHGRAGRSGALAGFDTWLNCWNLNRIVLTQPLFDFLALSCDDDALPFYAASSLTVLSHYIRSFVQDLNETIRLRPFEVVRRQRSVIFFLHLHLL